MKPSLMIISVFFFLFLLCIATSTAALTTSNEKVYSRLRQHSMFYRALSMLSNPDTCIDSPLSNEADVDIDLPDSDPLDDVLLPETISVEGPVTSDNGNEPVTSSYDSSDDSADSPTVDVDGPEGQTLQDSWTIDEPGVDEVVSNVVEENGDKGVTLVRVIDNFVECNRFGDMLKNVVERIYAPGTGPGGTATPVVSNVVVQGDPTGTVKQDTNNVVIVTTE